MLSEGLLSNHNCFFNNILNADLNYNTFFSQFSQKEKELKQKHFQYRNQSKDNRDK